MNSSARSSKSARTSTISIPATSSAARATWSAGAAAIAWPGGRHLCAHTQGVGVNRPGAFAEFIALPMTNIWRHDPKIDQEVAAIFDPFGNAVHTALSFPVLGEDVLITGAGPIGIMAIPVVRHAGARHVVITDMNPFRLELARKMGATLAVNPTETTLAEVQKQLGMQEGFDVGLEMSGNAQALRDMIANMSHGGKIAMLGIPAEETPIDWRQVIFNMLTIKGIYGREMYETWYKMTVMLESGVDISPVITHRFAYSEFQKGFDAMISGQTGKVILDWTTLPEDGLWSKRQRCIGKIQHHLQEKIKPKFEQAGLYKRERVHRRGRSRQTCL